MNIYFAITTKPKNITALLLDGFTAQNGKFVETFTDEELTQSQCHRARRSFIDLWDICKTYFPKCTKERLAWVLLNNIPGLMCFTCPIINRVVFQKDRHEKEEVGCPYSDNNGIAANREDPSGISYNIVVELAKNYKHKKNVSAKA